MVEMRRGWAGKKGGNIYRVDGVSGYNLQVYRVDATKEVTGSSIRN